MSLRFARVFCLATLIASCSSEEFESSGNDSSGGSGGDAADSGATGGAGTIGGSAGERGVGGTSSSGGSGAAGGVGGSVATGGAGGGSTGCDDSASSPCGGADNVCTDDGSCCAPERTCGTTCCGTAEVCSFQECVLPGDECADALDCAAGEYCEYTLGDEQEGGATGSCPGGVVYDTGTCLVRPPACGGGLTPPACVEVCEHVPTPATYAPTVKYGWGDETDPYHNVMMTPIVTQLDDDDCNGQVDERDTPDIVFFSFYGADYNNIDGDAATLRAISIVDGAVVEKWTAETTDDAPARAIAAGDLDGEPGNEIVVCTVDQRARAYDSRGTILWTSPALSAPCFAPSIANLDQAGAAEVILRGDVLDGATGAIEHTLSPGNDANVVVSDVTGDGALNLVTPSRVYEADGTLVVDSGLDGTHPAVADLDNNGAPEIVSVDSVARTVSIWRVDASASAGFVTVRQGVEIDGGVDPNHCCQANPSVAGCIRGGGPPTLADFNGDGFPDVGVATGAGYTVLDGQTLMDDTLPASASLLWHELAQDCSSAVTGSSAFDFDGDGAAEIIYADETTLRIFAGDTGTELFSTCNTTGTLWEYPVVADVDEDGHADIIVPSNSYSSVNCGGTKTTGIRVFGDDEGHWVRTRRTWNQYAYHGGHIEDDGSVPVVQPAHYLDPAHNGFRKNILAGGELAAPDLIAEAFPACGSGDSLIARVRNVGQSFVPAGVVVGFYDGDPQGGGVKLGEETTPQPLYPLESEDVEHFPSVTPSGSVYVVVDEGNPPHAWEECRTDNNISAPADPSCDPD